MTGINLDQEIISASASANVGGVASVGAETSVDFRGSARLKRGIELELGVGAVAQIEAGFSKFLAADVTAQAQAKAQLKAQVQAPMDLFSEAGMAVRLQAVAQLALTGRLAIGLAMGDFIELAEADPRIDGVYMRLLEIFLEELEIQAGVQGRVAYSAMAYLNLVVAGRLVDDAATGLPAGFSIAADCGAGLKGGGGWEMFANMGLANPRRFIRRSIDVLVDEMVRELGQRMPDTTARTALRLLRAPAKMALRGGFELGLALAENASALSNAGPVLAQRCVQVVLEEAQRVLLEQLTLLAIDLIREGLEQLGAGANAWQRTADQREFLVDQLSGIPDDPFEFNAENLTYWSGVMNAIGGISLELAANQLSPQLAGAVSILWSSVQLSLVTTQRVTDASVRASFFGTFTAEERIEAFKGQTIDQAPAPTFVRAHINAALGRSAQADVEQQHLVTFLTGSALDALVVRVPDARPLLEIVAGPNASPAALSAAANTILNNAGAFVPTGDNNRMDPEASLRALSEGLQSYIDVRINNEVVPLIYAHVPDQPELRLYVDDVLLPSMTFIIETAFDSVLDTSFGNVAAADALRDACSGIVMKVVGRSLVVTTDILMTHASREVAEQLRVMAEEVDNPGGFGEQLAGQVGADRELVGEVLHESLHICADVFGPLPDDTRAKIRNLLYMIIDSVPANPDNEWLEQLQQDLFIPNAGVRDALLELGGTLGQTLAGYLQDFYERVLTRIGAIALEEAEQFVAALVDSVVEWAEEVRSAVQDIATRLAELPGEIAAQLQLMSEALSAAVADVANFLSVRGQLGPALAPALRGALNAVAQPRMLSLDAFIDLAAPLRDKALDALSSTVSTATQGTLLAPVLATLNDVGGNTPVLLLEQLRAVLATARNDSDSVDLLRVIREQLIDYSVAQVRRAFDDTDPAIDLQVGFSVTTPGFTIPGTGFHVPPITAGYELDLGELSVSLDEVELALRNALDELAVLDPIVARLASALTALFNAEDRHAALTAESAVLDRQQTEFAEALAQADAGPRSITVLDPLPGALHAGDLSLDIHIRNATVACLGLDPLVQPRLSVLLNQDVIAPERFAATPVAGEPAAWTLTALDLNLSLAHSTAASGTGTADELSKDRSLAKRRVTAHARGANTAPASHVGDNVRRTQTQRAARRAGHGSVRRHSLMGALDDRHVDTTVVVGRKIPQLMSQDGPDPAGKDADVGQLGRGLRLRLQVPRDELRLGMNTLTVVATDGAGLSATQVVTFVVAQPELPAKGAPVLTRAPELAFDALPADVARWMQLADKLDAAGLAGRCGGEGPGVAPGKQRNPQADEAPLWVLSKSKRRRGLKRAVRQEGAHRADTCARLGRVRAAIEAGALRPGLAGADGVCATDGGPVSKGAADNAKASKTSSVDRVRKGKTTENVS